jgi:hypothetical protein
MLDTKRWKTKVEVISPKLQEWKTQSQIVVIAEEDGVLKAKTVSNVNEVENPVSILAVETYREGVKISQLYNRMVAKRIKVQSLNKIVEAINILGEN